MKNVARLIEMNGGLEALAARPIKVEMPGYDRLCVELVGPAPTPGLVLISVAHYFVQNGDLMSDPEMTFEVNPGPETEDVFFPSWQTGKWRPASITQSPMGVYREVYSHNAAGQLCFKPRLAKELRSFAAMWNRNIGAQGYLKAFKDSLKAAKPAADLPKAPVVTPAPTFNLKARSPADAPRLF